MLDFLADGTRLPRMGEVISASPYAFLVGCVVWIPVCIWVYSMISWMVLGEVDAIFGTASAGLALVLGFMTSNPVNPSLAPLTFIAVLSMMALWPFLQFGANARIEHISRLDEVERAYERLESNPKDQGALFRLAMALKKLHMVGPAITMGERAVEGLDTRYYGEHIQLVKEWKEGVSARDALEETVCPACRFSNGPGIPYCPRCGEPQYMTLAYQFWKPKSFGARLLGAWAVAIAALVIIPLIASSEWPIPAKTFSIIGLSVIGVVVLVRTIILLVRDRQI